MNHYEQMIVEDTGCPPPEAHKVESIMRQDVFHSTLDWLTRGEFRRGARKAWRLLNEYREDYEEEFRQCRAAAGLPAEPGAAGGPTRCSEPYGRDEGVGAEPPLILERKQTVLSLLVFREDEGKTIEQGCRFHLAPCEDGRWFAWAEAHQPPDDPEPCDAFYDFYDGVGRAFATRAEALAAIYEYGAEFCAEEAEGVCEAAAEAAG